MGKGSSQGWNANRAALTSAAAWWRDQPDIPVTSDPFIRIGRRKLPEDRSRALDRAAVERLITTQRIPLRERRPELTADGPRADGVCSAWTAASSGLRGEALWPSRR